MISALFYILLTMGDKSQDARIKSQEKSGSIK